MCCAHSRSLHIDPGRPEAAAAGLSTGSQKGALGASRAAWRVAIDATLVSFEALRSGHKHDCARQSQVRAFCVDVGLQELVSPHPSLWRPARQVAHPLTKAQDHSVAHWRQRATDAVHQDDVDGQYPQSLMTSRWCPSSNMSHWPRLGRGQAPCSCSATATLKNDAIPVAIPD